MAEDLGSVHNYILLLLTCMLGIKTSEALSACDSKIWCGGQLLHDIQMANIYRDSKTFVDMNIKVDPDTVLSAYSNLSQGSTPSKSQLESFIAEYFEGPGTEFDTWIPSDYVKNPGFLKKLPDAKLRKFGSDLCQIWPHLGRKIKADVSSNQERYSLIYLKNPFIVPGGRFREIYYWDSYWTIKGLLKCEMTATVKGMLENLLTFVQSYGHVPNGGRIYYTRRSQPPLLIPMVDSYVTATGDTAFLRDNIDLLVKEYNFWAEHRNVTVGNNHRLNRYATPITAPRPESYREDLTLGGKINRDEQHKEEFYSNIASAAESGWDFSTRWFSPGYKKDDKSKWLLHVTTKNVLPVDLNSILCWNEKLLATFYSKLGNQAEARKWSKRHSDRVHAVDDVFWNEKLGSWFDYRISTRSHNKQFYPSNMFPLFTGCYPESRKTEYETKMLEYLKNQTLLYYASGIPTSIENSGQQWDFPNAWPPLMHAMITSLAGFSGEGREVALQLARKWIDSNYEGWRRTGKMFEKYVVTAMGSRGVGGEYNVQEGFGWTNGVVLDLLDMFGTELHIPETENNLAHAQSLGTRIVTFLTVTLTVVIFMS